MQPVLTFDQPLYWKAMGIKEDQGADSPVKACVLRLGDFHQLMSFLGGIGFIMQGSGLEAIFELIYAENSVNAMIDGKQISRALRAHILLYGAFYNHILSKIDILPNYEFIQELSKLASDSFTEGSTSNYSPATITTDMLVSKIQSFFQNEGESNTAKLWLQYHKMVSICLLLYLYICYMLNVCVCSPVISAQ